MRLGSTNQERGGGRESDYKVETEGIRRGFCHGPKLHLSRLRSTTEWSWVQPSETMEAPWKNRITPPSPLGAAPITVLYFRRLVTGSVICSIGGPFGSSTRLSLYLTFFQSLLTPFVNASVFPRSPPPDQHVRTYSTV